jgi:hypothetical protein
LARVSLRHFSASFGNMERKSFDSAHRSYAAYKSTIL